MSKLGGYLMRLAIHLSGYSNSKQKESKCDICSKKFIRIEEMEKHRRDIHPDMSPQEAEA